MRNAWSETLLEIAREDEKVILLVGDIGFGVFDKFRIEFPQRFINCGVAETNMIGTAAGLAMMGMKPIVYTIIPFLLMRTFEQIRNDICMQNLPVTLVGVGGGLSYGTLGPTHHAIEDISLMRSLPDMRIVSPCDPKEAQWCFKNIMKDLKPTYLRLGKGGEKNLLDDFSNTERSFGSPHEILKGKDISIVSSGYILEYSLKIYHRLKEEGHSISLINIHQIKPLNRKKIIDLNKGKKIIVVIEEHSKFGGLGDAWLDSISELDQKPAVIKIAIDDKFVKDIGDRDYLLNLYGFNTDRIIDKILKKLNELAS